MPTKIQFNLKLIHKVGIIIALAGLGLCLVAGLGLRDSYHDLVNAKEQRLKSVSEMAMISIKYYHKKFLTGTLSQQGAKEAAREHIKNMRYSGKEYFWINDMNLRMVMHPIKPALDGKDLSGVKDPNGKALFVEMVETIKKNGNGFVTYFWPKPGETEPVEKKSFVAEFKPWGWVIGTGVYTDDIRKDFLEIMKSMGIAIGCVMILILGVSVMIARGITKPLHKMRDGIIQISENEENNSENDTIEIPATDRGDEIGDLARAVQGFQDKAMERQRIAFEADSERRERNERERKEQMINLAADFEATVSQLTNEVATAAEQMQNTAGTMTKQAEHSGASANAVSQSATMANQHVQGVANAAQEMESAVNEIGGQVNQSTQITHEAVEKINETNQVVKGLASASDQIGEVVNLIQDIAEQTNLLALNATIEAARAGEMGKGFAVVASEVKGLASQTSKATEQISNQINAIQTATGGAVDAMEGISQTIDQINHISNAIAAAVEEQGASTREITENIHHAASTTNEMSQEITSVSEAAKTTQESAEEVSGSAKNLSDKISEMQSEMNNFVAEIRAG